MNNGTLVFFLSSSSSACHVMIDSSLQCIGRTSREGLVFARSPRLPFTPWSSRYLSETENLPHGCHEGIVIPKIRGRMRYIVPPRVLVYTQAAGVARGLVHNRVHNFYSSSQGVRVSWKGNIHDVALRAARLRWSCRVCHPLRQPLPDKSASRVVPRLHPDCDAWLTWLGLDNLAGIILSWGWSRHTLLVILVEDESCDAIYTQR